MKKMDTSEYNLKNIDHWEIINILKIKLHVNDTINYKN